MKVGPSAHYTVGVRPQEWEEPVPETAPLYRGIYAVELQHTVDISFVPDISSIAPPWDDTRWRMLPDDTDTIQTPELARLVSALLSSYVVTPNDRLAGTEDERSSGPPPKERFGIPAPPDWEEWDHSGVIFYVTTEEFARFVADLDALTEIAHGLHVRPLVDSLRDREVIAFIERRIVASSLLKPRHAAWLGQRR